MLNHELRHDDGILVLNPDGPLEAADFTALTSEVDAYLAQHGTLRGVFIRAPSFPGWKDYDALLAHLKFLKVHLSRIEKVAVVADGALANIMPSIANLFVHAQVQHFEPVREAAAWDWLRQTGSTQTGSIA